MTYKIFLNPKNSLTSADEYYQTISETLNNDIRDFTIFVPALLWSSVNEKMDQSNKIGCGLQGLRLTTGGGTGSVDPRIAHSMGIRIGLVGHSDERRTGMTTADIVKVIESTPEDFTLLVCVGEANNSPEAMEIFYQELNYITSVEITKKTVIYVTYEPQWLISTNKDEESSISHADTVTHCNQTIAKIKDIMQTNRVLYGGSVSDFSADELVSFGVEGFLIGSLSTKPAELSKFISSLNN